MDLGIQGKVALVAAASKGLGYGIARALTMDGAKVALGSRTLADVASAAARLKEESGSDVRGYALDASNAESIVSWAEAAMKDFGGVDMLVINAGGPPAGLFSDFDDAAWQKAFELTLMSAVRMIRAVIPSMKTRGGGSILAVTSSTVKEPLPILLLSNVMRSGVTALLKTLSMELAPFNIRVNNLVPGRFDTDRVRSLDQLNAQKSGSSPDQVKKQAEASIPLGRYGSTDEFGRAGAFLLSPAAAYITGETLIVDGGMVKTVW